MVTVVLDASALLRFLFDEAGAENIETALESTKDGKVRSVIASVNWGEVVGKVHKAQGKDASDALQATMLFHGLEIIPLDAHRAARAAIFKVDLKLGYADAICVELASSFLNSLLITADFDFKPAEDLVHIEFLPAKP